MTRVVAAVSTRKDENRVPHARCHSRYQIEADKENVMYGDTTGREEVKRMQRKRTKGWTMPPNSVYVGRPTRWGNPFPVEIYHEDAIDLYRRWLLKEMSPREMSELSYYGDPRIGLAAMRRAVQPHELRGKDLACWCKEGSPCHADILLKLANQP